MWQALGKLVRWQFEEAVCLPAMLVVDFEARDALRITMRLLDLDVQPLVESVVLGLWVCVRRLAYCNCRKQHGEKERKARNKTLEWR